MAMIPCAIIGDSIALELAAQMPECVAKPNDAMIGIGSAAIIWRVRPANTIIVSAGSNDPHNPRLRDNLEMIRNLAINRGALRVIWILPANSAGAVVMAVAVTHDDPFVPFKAGPDGVHPLSDKQLAIDVRKAMP